MHSVYVDAESTISDNRIFSKKSNAKVKKVSKGSSFIVHSILNQIIFIKNNPAWASSMKGRVFNLCILVICFVQSMNCRCCHPNIIFFYVQGIDLRQRKYVENFGASKNIGYFGFSPSRKSCEIELCKDGQPPVNKF